MQFWAQKPLLYANQVISLSTYCFNYIREINKPNKISDYFGIDLKGVKVNYLTPFEKLECEVNLRQKYDRAFKNRKQIIERQIEKYGDITTNSSNFFRHIRDSIAHDDYEIDYSKYLNTKKLDDIQVIFRTHEKETEDLDFEVEIPMSVLLRLAKELQSKINQCIEESKDGKTFEMGSLKVALADKGINTTDLNEPKMVEGVNPENAPKASEGANSKNKKENREGDVR